MYIRTSKKKLNNLFSCIKDAWPGIFNKSNCDDSGLIIAEEGREDVSFLVIHDEGVSEYKIPAIIEDPGHAAASFILVSEILRHLSDIDSDDLMIYGDDETITIKNEQCTYEFANNLEKHDIQDSTDEEYIELSLDDLRQMIEDNREREIGLEELLLMQKNNNVDSRERQEQDPLDSMRESLQKGNYEDAFASAEELRLIDYADYHEEINDCVLKCANAGVKDASIFLIHKLINGEKLKPEMFPFLQESAIEGYIPSFRWLAECYEKGIGCTKDIARAHKLYFEGMLFEDNSFCLYKWDSNYSPLRENAFNPVVKEVVDKMDEFCCWCGYEAKVKIGELILDGRIREYDYGSAYTIFKKIDFDWESYSCISGAKLGFCVLNGIGTQKDPIIALKILEEAEEYFEDVLRWWDDDWNLEYNIDQLYNREEEIIHELENVKEMIEQAKKQIKELDEYKIWLVHDGLTDEDDIYEAWKNENPLYIRRRDISWLEN